MRLSAEGSKPDYECLYQGVVRVTELYSRLTGRAMTAATVYDLVEHPPEISLEAEDVNTLDAAIDAFEEVLAWYIHTKYPEVRVMSAVMKIYAHLTLAELLAWAREARAERRSLEGRRGGRG